MARPNYKMSFLREKKTDVESITQKALPVLAPTIGSLIFLFSGMHGSFPVEKNLWMPEAIFFCGGGGGVGVAPFNHLLYLKFRSTPLPPRISNLIYKYTSISLFLGIRIPCGTKFLRESGAHDGLLREFTFFRIGDLFVFGAGTIFLRLAQIGFSCWELIFAIF